MSDQFYTKDLSVIDISVLKLLKNEDIEISEYSNIETLIKIKADDFLNLKEAADNLKIKRSSKKSRNTKETKIDVALDIDGKGESEISTGIGFFDHMLEQISKHANLNLTLKVDGDLHVDEHHTIEDAGITLGEAVKEAIGDKRGIQRYGFCIPMDETVAKCSIDLSGRSFLNFKCNFSREKVGDFPTEMTEEFFRGIAFGMGANLYLRAKGKNDHHKIEALFKVFAKSLNEACRMDERNNGVLPTTKGLL
ncbi:MAG: imidazoleglycerol-phosphate dehydratase HisB [Melioribacteraceae bacterium]|nr:imidazoleglycerol-phosphate dehydratase HisB [Melioribacteraceae bacterium]